LISVIIPYFNRESTIVRAVNSVINQSYKDIEIILVDDASTDKSLSVVRKISKTDKRILSLSLQKNSGVSEARNYGVSKSKGEYLAFLDSDDYWYKDHLRLLMNLLTNYRNCDFVYSVGNLQSNNLKGVLSKRFSLTNYHPRERFYINGYLSHSIGFIVSRVIFDKVGGWTKSSGCADDDAFTINVLKYTKCIYFPFPTFRIYSNQHGATQITSKKFSCALDTFKFHSSLAFRSQEKLQYRVRLMIIISSVKRFLKTVIYAIL